MKSNITRLTALCTMVFGIIACNTGKVPTSYDHDNGGGVTSEDGVMTVQTNNTNQTLDYYLRKVPGVVIRGSGPAAKVTIRGENSLTTDSEPLFILDGVQILSYASMYSAVNPMEIQSVRVLKSAAETAIYGIRGGSGVIIIKRKETN